MAVDLHKLRGKGNIYLVRHGQSHGCSRKIIKGRKDYPLSALGKKQAKKTGNWFKAKNIQAVLCSPLARAAQTAEAIAAHYPSVNVDKLPELIELDTGIFSDLSLTEIEQKYPRAWHNFMQKSWDGVPQAEHSSSLLKRAGSFWNHIFNLANRGTYNIAAVTHAGIMQWIIKSTLGHREWLPFFDIKHCAVFRLHYHTSPEQFYCSWDIMGLTAY